MGQVPPPPNFYGRAKITAKFGQNLKISEKFGYVVNKFLYLCENYLNFFCYVGKIL